MASFQDRIIKMIWYSYKANQNVIQGQFVQLSSDGLSVELHTTGAPLGLCFGIEILEDTQERIAKVYAAGGSGQIAILGADWSGSPSRFDIINSKVIPVSSGGSGWIVPEYPKSSRSQGDSVWIAIY